MLVLRCVLVWYGEGEVAPWGLSDPHMQEPNIPPLFQTGLPPAPLKNKELQFLYPYIHLIGSSKSLIFMDISGVIDGCKTLIFLIHGYKNAK
jgi:hypothetical protein